ncbi:hypothetical protein PBY51_016780 [Eleginops maclovinus]|uniref:Uncharacterized protein n=1 Tax=Eleginops maclovinus TaxID=56733 RepID=A0AAN7WQW6_ELEMC|nr:hypothetical protein PBY51_016780 [Eleginops maclovinus]
MRARLSASQRLPCAPRRCEAGKKGVGKPQFHQHLTVRSSKALCALCVCVCCYGGRSLKPMAEADTPESNTDTAKGRKTTWMRRQSSTRIVEAGLAE